MAADRPTHERLVQDVAAHRSRIGHATQQSSTLPLATFEACDPMVEAKLLDDVVMQVFLQHMGKTAVAVCTPEYTDERARENAISAGELRTFLARLEPIHGAPAPDLEEGLAAERLWILADIAAVGGGVARQRATQEIRDAMHDLSQWRGIDAGVLRQVVDALEREPTDSRLRRGGAPVLFQTLLAAARTALAKVDAAAP